MSSDSPLSGRPLRGPRPLRASDDADGSWRDQLSWRDSAALIGQVLEDPGAGLATLYRRYHADVNRLVWRLLGADVDHDDIVQQVFLHMLQSIHRVRSPETLSVWVRSVTVNVVRSELRKRYVRRAFLRRSYEPEYHPDLNTEVETRESLSRSLSVLNKLPDAERVVFILYYTEKMTLPDIAQVCGYSAMTAKRRLAAARTRLGKLLDGDAILRRLTAREETKA